MVSNKYINKLLTNIFNVREFLPNEQELINFLNIESTYKDLECFKMACINNEYYEAIPLIDKKMFEFHMGKINNN